MPSSRTTGLEPRKVPRQARSTATVDAVFEATIQVLVAEGPRRLTTTKVAKRAGVSVGTMYQYFPHKRALFYALNERYLEALAVKVEAACRGQHNAPIISMVEALVTTYWDVKMERPEVRRALYQSVAELDNEPLVDAFGRRVGAATAAMLASASDADFEDLATINLTLSNTIFGTVRAVCEHNLQASTGNAVLAQVIVMCVSYLETVRTKDKRGTQPVQGATHTV